MTDQKKLLIVESPAKAKTISKFLGPSYKVIASAGHVRDLPKSKLGIDVDDNFNMNYITIRGKGQVLASIRKEAKKAKYVYLATDPDREGEAISWHLAHILNIDPNSKCRIVFNEITKDAIKNAIKNPRPIDINKVDAQQARRAIDRLVGYGISPLLWAKVKRKLSAGRVQSLATRLIVERDREIEEFKPQEYWDISVILKHTKSKFFKAKLNKYKGKKPSINNENQAKEIEDILKREDLEVSSVKSSKKSKSPLAPFTTSSLQQTAVNKLNFTSAKTMKIAQELYEGISLGQKGTVGLLTYIRTDSVRISNEALNAVREHILSTFGKEYLPTKANEYKGRNNSQDAHEAIRPTYIQYTPDSIKDYLSKDQYKLYNLVYNRFIACQMKSAVFNTLSIIISSNSCELKSYSESLYFDGYRKIYADEVLEKSSNILPQDISQGDKIKLESVEKTQHFTEPKPHYTEASLVKELEEMGIGRPSTYAPTISTIISRDYVIRDKKSLKASELGELISDLLQDNFSDIIDYDFTANLENSLDKVESGDIQWKGIINGFYPEFKKELAKADEQIEKIEIKDEESDKVCEKCGKKMVYKNGKFGKFLACSGFPNCNNTTPIVEYVDAVCPKCGKRIIKRYSRKTKRSFYGCENYPNCDFVSWAIPSGKHCPKCNSYMIEKTRRNQKILLCSNEKCKHKININKEENE